jgi:hypothetical protein
MFLFGIQVWAGSCVCCQLFWGLFFHAGSTWAAFLVRRSTSIWSASNVFED